jgi:hypothetical protein
VRWWRVGQADKGVERFLLMRPLRVEEHGVWVEALCEGVVQLACHLRRIKLEGSNYAEKY